MYCVVVGDNSLSDAKFDTLDQVTGGSVPRGTRGAAFGAGLRSLAVLLLSVAPAAGVGAAMPANARVVLSPPATPAEATPAEVTPSEVTPAEVTPPEVTPAEVTPPPAEQAQALFEEGVTLYKMSEYTGALEKFAEAFKYSARIEDDGMRGRVLHALQFNLARAHVKTYSLDQDVLHLRQAVDLLEKYLENSAGLRVDGEAEALMAEAKAELARRDRNARGGSSSPPAPGRALKVGGYTSLGVAAAGLGIMVGGLVMAKRADGEDAAAKTAVQLEEAERRGKLGNTLSVAGAVTAGVCAAVGATLVVLGTRAARRDGAAARVWLRPSAGAALTGVQVGGRF